MQADREVPVLIVGGSLVGMSTALLLGYHGVRALAVEHHRGTAIHPRAAQISQRTMEIFRTAGIEQTVKNNSEAQFVQDGAIMAVETLAGKEIGYFIANLNEGVRDVSPVARVFISQSLLEPLLKSRAEELGAELQFSTEMTSFEEDKRGVTAVIQHRDTGRSETIRASYMIAADGAHSRIREKLRIARRGRGVFSNSVTIYFRGDVAPVLAGRNLSVIYVNNAELRGFFRFEKPFDSGFLAVNALGDPANPVVDVSTGLTEARAAELVRTALGTDSVEITIENVMPWKAEAQVAESFRRGRVFLAGDSAHVMPPNGGFGGNTGVQDAHNLAWKLALVLRGSAGPELLSSYESERLPVTAFTVEQAYSRYVTRTAPYLGTEGIEPVVNDLNVELGYAYHSSAIIADEDDDGRVHCNPRESWARAGTRAPHVWVDSEGQPQSTLDWYGRNFVLLVGPGSSGWRESAPPVADKLGISIDVREIDSFEAHGVTPSGALIVRPDGFVAWRSKGGLPGSPETLLGLFRMLLSR